MTDSPQSYRVLVVLTAGIAAPNIMQDYAAAFKSLGHSVLFIDTRTIFHNNPHGEVAHEIARTADIIRAFDPHFAVFYNSSGLIPNPPGLSEHGKRHLLESLGIPHAALFYDSPLLPVFLNDIKACVNTPLYTLFIWDRHYLHIVEKHYGPAHYLPLATNPEIFYPREPDPEFTADVCFIGSIPDCTDFSAQRLAGKWPQVLVDLAASAFTAWQADHEDLDAILDRLISGFPQDIVNAVNAFRTSEQFTLFINSIQGEIGRHTRLNTIRALPPVNIHVHGGPGWRDLQGSSIRILDPVEYHKGAPVVYSSAKINLNISSHQLVTSLNQRAFDVPACGAFLLTDFREDAARLFSPGDDIVIYRDMDDLKTKVEYFLEHDDERMDIAARVGERVLREHTYAHRAASIIEVLKTKVQIP